MSALVFEVPLLAPSLNGPKGLIRMHWATYRRVRERWTLEIRSQLGPRRPRLAQSRVEVVRRYATHALDPDNLAASLKVPLDALRHAGVIADDDPDSVLISFRQEKVATRKEEGTTITVTPQ